MKNLISISGDSLARRSLELAGKPFAMRTKRRLLHQTMALQQALVREVFCQKFSLKTQYKVVLAGKFCLFKNLPGSRASKSLLRRRAVSPRTGHASPKTL